MNNLTVPSIKVIDALESMTWDNGSLSATDRDEILGHLAKAKLVLDKYTY